jgi:hypothetical protein
MLASQYIYIFLINVCSRKHSLFPSNLDSCTTVTRQKQNLCFPQANLTIYQKGVYYAGIKILKKLPIGIKNTSSNLS